MARKLTAEDVARGKRLTEIRTALDMTQGEIVEPLNKAAEALGLPARYKYYTVSRMESGSMSFEDAAAWLLLDPGRREGVLRWDWLVFGDERKTASLRRIRKA